MRIKKDFLPCFLLVIAVLFFGLLAPASADFKKVNERELARANASVTGQIGTILCPDPADLNKELNELEEADCVAIPAEKQLVANEGSLSSVYTDYGYDWWKNLKVAGDLYYEDSSKFSPLTTVSGIYGDKIWIKIGLGSQEAEVDSWDTNVTVDCCSDGDCTYCQDQLLGSLHLDGLAVKTNGNSYVTMYMVKGRTGIGVDVDVTVDRIDLATISWGDPDGFAGASDAGYVGLKNTSITGVTAKGSVAIDVAKEDGGVHSVHIRLIDDMNVGMATLDTTVALGDKKDFSGTRQVLGSLYMKNLEMKANGDLKIYSGTEESTTLDLGLKIPLFKVGTLSWGDADGFAGASNAGYVGLRNLEIRDLAINGLVTVEEVCPSGGTEINHPVVVTGAVRIDIKNMKVNMPYMSTVVALGSSKDNLNQSLGIVSLSGLRADISGTVQISAH